MRRQARTSSNNPNNSRPASPRLASAARSSVVTLAGVFTLAGLAFVGCDDEDTTGVITAGSSGSSGDAGSSGSAGMGGGSAGSAGSGGGAGTGGGGSGGMGGSGGSQGGAAGDPDAGDGGPIDGGDAGPVDPRVAIAEAVCVKLDAVDACDPRVDCVNGMLGDMAVFDSFPTCPALVTAYFECVSGAPQGAFECASNVPQYQFGNAACTDEENTMLANGGDGTCP